MRELGGYDLFTRDEDAAEFHSATGRAYIEAAAGPEPRVGQLFSGPGEPNSIPTTSPNAAPTTTASPSTAPSTAAPAPVAPAPDTSSRPTPQPETAQVDPAAAAPAPVDAAPIQFRPGTDIRVPSGTKARIQANLAAIDVIERLHREDRPATAVEQEVLATWSGWGACADLFDRRTDQYAAERDHLRETLGPDAYRAAEASILNAHYTDPAIAHAMWDAVRSAGFTGGRVLEPGCGSGNFIGLAPPDAVMVGVENDPMTAAIAAALYPNAQIRSEGFETTRVPAASFAAVVGNVPFGNFSLVDPAHNPQGFSIHNHFINKALALTAPGGYVTVLTSRYTMDSMDTRARRAMAEQAELVGAVRLPSTAFKRVAGTEVVTDILVLRRKDFDASIDDDMTRWIDTEALDLEDVDQLVDESVFKPEHVDGALNINEYFHNHPENVLGSMALGQGIYGSATLKVVGETTGDELATQVRDRLGAIIEHAQGLGRGLTATPESLIDVDATVFDPGLLTAADRAERPIPDTLRYNEATSSIQRWTGHAWVEQRTPKSRLRETRSLIELRDAAQSVIASQGTGQPLEVREQLRAHLNRLYDDYVTKHGPVNRFKLIVPGPPTQEAQAKKYARYEEKWRKDQGDEGRPYRGPVPQHLQEEWAEKAAEPNAPSKRRPHLDGGMKDDPGWAHVASLEIFNELTGVATKAPIFSVDVLSARTVPETAATISDAMAISMDQRRGIDIDYIATLLNVDADTAREQLRGLAYPSLHDPEELVPAVTALSGNVREKLVAATDAAERNPVYDDYVTALRQVMPRDKEASQIKTRPGTPWIDAKYIAQFARETFGADKVTADHVGGTWSVECPNNLRGTVAMTETWGTESKDAIDILDALCNSKPIVVNRPAEVVAETGGPALDFEATSAAQAKAAKITQAFQKWIFADDTRRDILVTEFNRRFNSLVAPNHHGDHLTLPGLSDKFEPHHYQRDAVARIIAEPTVLLDHVVGAGKTGSCLMGMMELKRLGLVSQPWFVVPNHIVEQVGREAAQWYPAARILLGEAGTNPEGRRRFVSQSAAADWDMVIVPQSLFTAIGVNEETQREYIQKQLDELDNNKDRAVTSVSKKRIEAQKKRLDARLKEMTKQERKDSGLRFEQSGCDYLVIDEAHMFKNKGRLSNIEELSCASGAQRAEDLAMKLGVLRQRRREEGRAAGLRRDQIVERVATFATGTPVANSLGELWVMQNYLRPDLLAAAGVADINDWGAAFTTTVSTVEFNATGTSLRPVTRVGKFCNLPELLSLSSIFTDVVTRDEVPMALPKLVDGHRSVISMVPDQVVKDFITDLGWRLDHLDPRRPDKDNTLKCANDGRNVSLDPRMANLPAPAVSRASRVADEMIRVYRANADRAYRDADTGEISPIRGGFQIGFCDRGTPSKDKRQFTIYGAIRDELIARGMPAERIAFIHDAAKPAEKLALQHRCRSGEISVLIGSTEKMGTGMNVQTRATALHHIDVPWRPADLEQREGRIIRQGNQNEEVEILTYVTEGAFDTVMWQKVEAKAKFIEQVKRENVDIDEIEDLGGGDISGAAAETKAIATGDPRYVKQVQLDDDVKRLTALENAHLDAGVRRDRQRRDTEREYAATAKELANLDQIIDTITHTADQPLQVAVGGKTFAERKDAAEPFAAACRDAFLKLKNASSFESRPLGATINGISITASRSHLNSQLRLTLDVPCTTVAIDDAEVLATAPTISGDTHAAKARGLLQRMENAYKDIPHHRTRLDSRLTRLQGELDDFDNTSLGDFEHAAELEAKRLELSTLTAQLRMEAQSEAAQAKAAAAEERMLESGRQPGWTLELNPTPALVAESGLPDAASYRAAELLMQQHRANEYFEKQRDMQRERERAASETDHDDVVSQDQGWGTVFSFRAECEADVEEFFNDCEDAEIPVDEVLVTAPDEESLKVVVQFRSEPETTAEALRDIAAARNDLQTVVQTLRPVPLADNTLEPLDLSGSGLPDGAKTVLQRLIDRQNGAAYQHPGRITDRGHTDQGDTGLGR
ncbi:helicase-related protein [Mycobacteroides abscessus]|uniref:helicase-related protein n=3 Tax=Mycobacteroides abscessus TaxID=36809 RepID=UPI0009D4AE64|nr:helicase-related protein [Mycobacteroides abscessus]SLJ77698.1 DNA methylase [Mycobacteroides abscessus subsp. abscessus]